MRVISFVLAALLVPVAALGGQLQAPPNQVACVQMLHASLDREGDARSQAIMWDQQLSAVTAERDALKRQFSSTPAALDQQKAEAANIASELTTAKQQLDAMTTERDKLTRQIADMQRPDTAVTKIAPLIEGVPPAPPQGAVMLPAGTERAMPMTAPQK